MFTILNSDIFSQDATTLLDELNAALMKISGNSGQSSFSAADVLDNRGIFLIGYWDGEPISCGAIREFSPKTAEMKRIYARKNSVGAARKIVYALEECALKSGFEEIQLETRVVNEHAIAFYQDCGYQICPNYGKYINREEAICFLKKL